MLTVAYLLGLLLFLITLVAVTVAVVIHAWCMQMYTSPFVPSRGVDIADMLRSIDIRSGMRVLDLGSGTGDVMLAFAKCGAHVTGIEINPVLLAITKVRLLLAGIPRSQYTLHQRDFFEDTLPDADVVVLYLLPQENERLSTKLTQELPNAIIITNRFDIGQWQHEAQHGRVRTYRVPTQAQ